MWDRSILNGFVQTGVHFKDRSVILQSGSSVTYADIFETMIDNRILFEYNQNMVFTVSTLLTFHGLTLNKFLLNYVFSSKHVTVINESNYNIMVIYYVMILHIIHFQIFYKLHQ